MKWETVIGLEVHTELATKSKIFCGCSTAYSGGANTHVCPGCAGMPGALPVLNRSVVEFAMRLGIALHCDITQNCSFDRKSYFYPDLPNAYQITQFYSPICRNGYVEIDIDGKKKKIGLKQIHMEEDAGKLVHDPYGTRSFIDLNRCSMPLLEIVSLPDLRGPDEVIAYMEKLREIMLYLEVSDCKMQEGSIRADINLSVRQPGEGLGVRTEMKNMNSFKAIVRAIEFENYRHIEALEDGTPLYQETRRWDDEKGESYAMRNKENAQDYRYFPDPDLPSLRIDDAWLERVRTELPELAEQKRARYVRDLGISEAAAGVLTANKNISVLFETVVQKTGQAAETANLITGEIIRLMNSAGILPEDLFAKQGAPSEGRKEFLPFAQKLAVLVNLVTGGKINRGSCRQTVEAVFTDNVDPEKYIAEKGLLMVSDDNTVTEAVRAVMAEERNSVEDYRAGKAKVFGFLMGQVMKKIGKAGNPELAKKVLEDALKA